MLSIGLFALAVLTLLGLSITILKTDSKALERSAGTLIANQVMDRAVAQLSADPTVKENFFSGEYVASAWDTGQLINDHTTFYYKVQVVSVVDASNGTPLGTAVLANRLKKISVHVWWAGQDTQSKQGSGQLEVWSTRLVSEAEVPVAPTP